MADMTTKILAIELKADAAVNGIINLNNAIDKNTQQMKANSAQIKQNNIAIEKGTGDVMKLTAQNQVLAQSNVELSAKTKVLKDERRLLQKETQNEIKMQTEEEGSLRSLRAELSKATQEFDKLSRAERENGTRGKELKDQINSLTTEIKDAEFATQRYYRNVGNYQNAILGALGINGKFATSIVNITNVSGGVQGAFSAMGSSVKAFGASLMGLLTNPVFLAIAGIAGVGMAFKWFYDYNEGLAEATRLTKEFTGYAGDDLLAMRNSIQATADVMGKDFKETLQSADTIMANFHVTGEEAMDIINKGFAAGADVNGDFLAKVQQLAPTFHDAGISASEMVAIITQTRSGIFTDQGLEAIKQGSARLREMSSTTRQALEGIGIDVNEMQRKMREGTMGTFEAVQQVSAQLKTLPNDAQEVGEVMSAVFGRQGKFASQEMIESLATMSTSLDEVKDKTGEYGDLLLENINTEEELDNVTSAIFDMTNKGWEEAKQKATIYAKQALVAVVKGLLDVTNWFIRLYNKSLVVRTGVQMIIASFNTLWQVVKFVFNVIVNAVNRMGDAFEALADVIEGVFSLDAKRVYQGWQKAEKAFKDGWSQLAKDAVSAGKAVGEGYANAVNNAVTGQLEELSIPAFSGAVGGGGSTGGNGGGGGRSRTTGGGSKGSRGGRGRTSTPKKATTKSTTTTPKETPEQKAAREAEEAAQKKMNALIAEGEKLKMQALQERAKKEAKAIDELAEAQKQEIIKKYGTLEELQARLAKATTDADKAQAQGAIDGYNLLMADVEKKRSDAITKMIEESTKARKEADAKAAADAKTLAQTWFDSTTEGTQAHLKWQLELIRMEKEAELALYENNGEMKQAIIAKYAKQEEDARKQSAQAIQQIEQTKYEAIGTMVGGLGEIMGAFGDQSKEAAILQKTLALGEIMIAQAVAIANAVKAGSNAVTPWQMIAQIATSIVTVTTAMAQAFAALDQAKFATGGYVSGAGTSTSDSIPIRVSNGESIMNAETTAMFGGLLSSLNQLGGGVPIQVQETAASVRGEDMLARAFARGVAMLPNPVVSVEDINRGQRKVEVMNERATL